MLIGATASICIASVAEIFKLKSETTSQPSPQQQEDAVVCRIENTIETKIDNMEWLLNDTVQLLLPYFPLLQNESNSVLVQDISRPTTPHDGGVGWRSAVSLDMGDPLQQCPSPWIESATPNRSCHAQYNDNCIGVSFPVSGVTYSRVHGRAVGYGSGTPDAFYNRFGENNGRIDGAYLDGVSITHGLPRQYIWSFGNGHGGTHRCPCGNPDRIFAPLPPAFVGGNYFCDGDYDGALWDGMDCTSTCCTFNSPPWFNVTLPVPTSDDIEVRICSDQTLGEERTHLRLLKLYVQ